MLSQAKRSQPTNPVTMIGFIPSSEVPESLPCSRYPVREAAKPMETVADP